MDEIIDLDIIRPNKKRVKLAGKIVDVSYVPCGVTFEVDDLIRKLGAIGPAKLENDPAAQKEAFSISIKLCSLFFSVHYPDMTEKWFLDNVAIDQINVIVDAIKDALIDSYKGVERYGKN